MIMHAYGSAELQKRCTNNIKVCEVRPERLASLLSTHSSSLEEDDFE